MSQVRIQPAARSTLAIFVAVLVGIVVTVIPASRSDAAGPNRGGIVVDLGNGTVKTVAITFGGSITGIEALQLGGFAPTVRSFGGLGGAVCALNVGGTQLGCPTDTSCLICAEPKYWVYFRAPAGSTGFSMSRGGAGATTMRDGDIDGWRWQSGSTPPPYVSIETLFPATTTTAAPTTTTARAPTTTRGTKSATTSSSRGTTQSSTGTQSTIPPAGDSPTSTGGSPNTTTAANSGVGSVPTTHDPAQGDPRLSIPGLDADAVDSTSASQRDAESGEPRAAGPPSVASTRSDGVAIVPLVIALTAIALLIAAIVFTRMQRNRSVA